MATSAAGMPQEASSAREERLRLAASRRLASIRLVMERVEDRGNRSAVLRTAEALGLLHVDEIGAASPERGRARGVAHGGEKWLWLHAHASPADCRAACAGHQLLAALPPSHDERRLSESWHLKSKRKRRRGADGDVGDVEHEAEPGTPSPSASSEPLPTPIALEAIDFSRPTALVFGNERLGVSRQLLALCDGAFTIPMYGLTESLNVSVAASIAIHHSRVARTAALRHSGGLNENGGDLSPAEVQDLLTMYLSRGRDFAKGGHASEVASASTGREEC
jgi:tRNA (guanosine-2'-O-)-methyltransferase